MSAALNFTVPGNPVGKGRPRVARRGWFARMYTPEKTASYESLVKMAGHQAMAGRDLFTEAVAVTLDVWVPIPASWSQRKQTQAIDGAIRPTTKPDLDNVAKAIFDGLNGIAWKDDVQVVRAVVTKRYSTTPRVDVSISHVAH
jgi:Holliday junction resolvase RusA-like endonuclease